MSSIIQTIQKRSFYGLPLSQTDSNEQSLRRRLSLKIQPISSPASSWAFRRSKSVSEYAGISIRKWWDWGWNWVLSRKPTFAKDLELNQQETSAQGSWRHVFYKVRSELRKLVGSDNVALPQTYRYDSFKNFNSTH